MKRYLYAVFLFVLICLMSPVWIIGEIDIKDTKFLGDPAISKNHIAFVYAGDLWIANVDGTNVRRLTTDEGTESNPVFSPDGKWISFSAQYDGNTDVYIVSVDGGVPERLTWHPGADFVRDFTPDGSAILFNSGRSVFTNRHRQLFTVPVKGGFPEALKIPYANRASYSPEGKKLAYTPYYEMFYQWKNYRGGTVSTIRLYTFSDHSVTVIPQPAGRCNDTDPMWIGDKIYFRSDRNGEFNLFSYDTNSEKIEQLTEFTDFPILKASSGDNKIIFNKAGQLYVYEPESKNAVKLTIGVAADLSELRERYAKGSKYIRTSSISPTGARAVFDFRGEIVTVPAEKGDPRNITNTTGVHEQFPVWSPDGKLIAYLSDESTEYQLHISQQDGKGSVQKFKLTGSGFYTNLNWSPDSKMLTYADNARNLYLISIENGNITKIDTEPLYVPGAFGRINGAWSGDSKWIAYELASESYFSRIFAYSVEENKSYPITDGLSDVSNPVFDKSGKYIYFFASTDAGPVRNWFTMTINDMRMTRSIYLATLRKDIPSPLAKESDEETGSKEKENSEKKSGENEKETDKDFTIDFDGLNTRIIALPVEAANYFNLQTGEEGNIYYLEAPATAFGPLEKGAKLHKYDLKERKDDVIIDNINHYEFSFDKKKMLTLTDNTWKIIPSSGKSESGKGRLKVDEIEVIVDPSDEWRQIFHEAWRINRDYFYATNMHGADWEAMRDKYSPFLAHLACRQDLNLLITWMCSELSVGHHFVGGGDYINNPDRIPGGLLGADYVIENNRYRFSKVYGGLNWNPDLRSPLAEPGVSVKAKEYLLAVNGNEVDASSNLYSNFENTSGKILEITVGPNPDFEDSRTLDVVPISDEGSLRNRDWVEGNIEKVNEATNGRVAYVYVPNTASLGHTYFKRYFFPQANKDAIIVDERFNGGGSVADYYIDILSRPFVCMWHTRYGADFKSPFASIQGPRVMIIDETAGSGGDLLPWMFRKFKLGKLVGKRTWGGLVGVLGFPRLMDGGYVSAPNLAFWTEDGWEVENEGVPPDIEVEQWPAEVIAGKDPQLEKAIEVIMDELEKNPPVKLIRPPYPVKVK
ncbi:PDZ domain-containing protein [Bacteroidota bacterium]